MGGFVFSPEKSIWSYTSACFDRGFIALELRNAWNLENITMVKSTINHHTKGYLITNFLHKQTLYNPQIS